MRVLAVNGSPRKNGNTAALLEHALSGARSRGAEGRRVDLYDLRYRGCVSCFYCKRKDRPHGTCALRDDLSPLLAEIRESDAVIFGSPIYYDNITSGMATFLERLLFSNYIYSEAIPTVFPKALPTGFIYDMNITRERAEEVHLYSNLENISAPSRRFLGASRSFCMPTTHGSSQTIPNTSPLSSPRRTSGGNGRNSSLWTARPPMNWARGWRREARTATERKDTLETTHFLSFAHAGHDNCSVFRERAGGSIGISLRSRF